ncbi:c-type cytochrome biogenesis protein CcmI [Thalassotalea sp. 42_200_T64]|nr:c-type cytochrome biogenesis protein CcmI [Thalassotalea sp. 42_200_T64]
MTSFWIITAVLFIIACAIVFYAYIKSKKQQQSKVDDSRKNTNVSLYHEHLQELDNDLAEGAIEQSSYQQLKSELNKTLLQDVDNSDQPAISAGKLSLLLPIAMTLFIVTISMYLYNGLGASQLLAQPAAAVAENPHQNLDMNQQALFRVQQLKIKVENEPTNSQAWFSLGQAFTNVSEFDNAVRSFDQVISLIGEHAELIGPKAQALYYKNDNQMNADIQALIDRALALDPIDASTNVLLGMDNYAQHNYAQAIEHWQLVLDSGRPGVNTQALEGAISEARNQLAQSQQLSGGVVPVADVDPDAPRLTLAVSLSDEMHDILMAGDDKTVFVYATATSGPRMPLAAVKIKASDLPITIVLDDSQAMTAQMNLSSVDKVNVYAVVSMQGDVGIKAGDYKSQLMSVDVMATEKLTLTIDTLVN